MKKITIALLLFFVSSLVYAQVTTINKTATMTIKTLPQQRAVVVRSQVVDLKMQLKKFSDSVTVTKLEIDNVVSSMKNDLDKMSEMGEAESLRLQMAMDRLSKMMSTLSNLLKKASETASGITQNMK